MKKATIKDVAEVAGVSISSVSRYINDPNSINPIAAVKVGEAIKQLNYVPSSFAQNLKRGHSNTIGVLVPDLTPFFSKACIALNRLFYENNYLLIICDTNYDIEKEQSYLRALIQQRVAGIVLSTSARNEDFLPAYTQESTHLVHFDRDTPHKYYDSVGENNIESSYNITKHVIEQGYDDIALFFDAVNCKNTIGRYDSSLKAIDNCGFNRKNLYVKNDTFETEKVFSAVKEFMGRNSKKKAIISFTPRITENVTIALNLYGYNIGEDVQLAGFTLEDYYTKYRLNIPRIVEQPYEMGLKTGEIMLRKIRKQQVNQNPKSYVLQNKVVF